MPEPTAAQALYGHLPSGERREVAQRRTPSVADAIFPAWSKEAKQRDADQRLWNEICKRQRENFVRGLREANAIVDRRMREGR
jgi:hypothetical protein